MAKKRKRPALLARTNFSDVCIAFINKGFPVLLIIAGVIVIAIFNMPEDEVASFTLKAIETLSRGWLNLIFVFLWILTWVVYHYKVKMMQQELDRMTAERNVAQKQAGSNTESSEA